MRAGQSPTRCQKLTAMVNPSGARRKAATKAIGSRRKARRTIERATAPYPSIMPP